MIKISDIAQDLVSKYDLSKREADNFTTAMFEVILNGLHESGSQVKVKGLGTFKLTTVSSRESVDVNTGERIVIGGRDKISFTPETLLKDRVNAPFAQFETVVLNEGVDFSAIEAEAPQEKEQQKPEDFPQEPTVVPQAEAKENQQETEEQPQEPTGGRQEVEEKLQIEAEQKPIPMTEPTPKSSECSETSEEPALPEFPKSTEPLTTSDTSASPSTPAEEGQTSTSTTIRLLVAAIIVVVVLMGIGGYLMFDQLTLRDERIEQLEMKIANYTQQAPTQQQPTTSSQHSPTAEAPSAESTKTKSPIAATETVASKETEKPTAETTKPQPKAQPQIPDQSRYNQDPRIRTGAYVIMGIDKEVKARAGQTLQSISRTYLGPDMECYVEAVNPEGQPKVGQMVKIPKLLLKKRIKH